MVIFEHMRGSPELKPLRAVLAGAILVTGISACGSKPELRPTQTPTATATVAPTVEPRISRKDQLKGIYDMHEGILKAALNPGFIKEQPAERWYQEWLQKGANTDYSSFLMRDYIGEVVVPENNNNASSLRNAETAVYNISIRLPQYDLLSVHPELNGLVEDKEDSQVHSAIAKSEKQEEIAQMLFNLPEDMEFSRNANKGIQGLIPLSNGNKILVQVGKESASFSEIRPALWKRIEIERAIRTYLLLSKYESDTFSPLDIKPNSAGAIKDAVGNWIVYGPFGLDQLSAYTQFGDDQELQKMMIYGRRTYLKERDLFPDELEKYVYKVFNAQPRENAKTQRGPQGEFLSTNDGLEKRPNEPGFMLIIDKATKFNIWLDYTSLERKP